MAWLFLSVCLYAVNNVLWKLYVKGQHPLFIISRRAIFTVALAFAAAWITKTDLSKFIYHPNSLYVYLASLFGALGLVMMVSFLKEGNLVQMAFYSLLGAGIAASYSFLFREVAISPKAIVGSILIVLGYLIFCIHEHQKVKKGKILLKQHLLLISMTLAFSVSLLIQWESLKIFSSLAIICTQETVVLVVTTAGTLFLYPKKTSENSHQINLKMALMALVIFSGIFAGTIGLKSADPFMASVAGFTVPVLSAFAGGTVFQEKLTIIHTTSLLLMIGGGICML